MRHAIPHYVLCLRGCAECTVVHPRYICLCKSSLILRGNEISRGAGRRARLSTPGMNSLIARVSGTSRIADFYRGLFSLLLARLPLVLFPCPSLLHFNVNNPRESAPRREFLFVVSELAILSSNHRQVTKGGERIEKGASKQEVENLYQCPHDRALCVS